MELNEQNSRRKSKAQAAVTEEKPTAQQLIYIGPTLGGGRLPENKVFIGGKPMFLKDLFEKYPDLDTLFVPVSDLTTSKVQLSQEGTPLNLAYQVMKGV